VTLFEWDTPVSPHLAAALEGKAVSDQALVDAVAAQLQGTAPRSLTVVETAGGVLSPGASFDPSRLRRFFREVVSR
jgi:dethiobiotin synthetase